MEIEHYVLIHKTKRVLSIIVIIQMVLLQKLNFKVNASNDRQKRVCDKKG